MGIYRLDTITRNITAMLRRVWDYAAVAAYCALAMGGGCRTDTEDPEGSGGCGGLYGPQPACQTDQDCRDWHDGGDWYCDRDRGEGCHRWPTCAPIPPDGGNPSAGSTGGE